MTRREINLIGGFYKDSSLPWSAQDTVNWLPVPAQEGGTRSPMKLRGAPGLRTIVRQATDLVGPAVWIYGPVNSTGGSTGNLHFYYVSPTAQTLTASAPVPIPAGMASTGASPVTRISVANNLIFLHGNSSPLANAWVSSNGGIDWTETNNPLANAAIISNDVHWNGRFYFWGRLRSADGITWSEIPNFPFVENPAIWTARTVDGAYLVSSSADRNLYITTTDGASWLTRVNPFGPSGPSGVDRPMAVSATTIVGGATGDIGFGWSDDLFATAAVAAQGPGSYIKQNGGIWLGARRVGTNMGLRRSLDGKAWSTVDTVETTQSVFEPSIATDGGTWAFVKLISASVFRLRLSTDGAQTWQDDVSLPLAGNIVYRGLP
jgi:hypothetical protein